MPDLGMTDQISGADNAGLDIEGAEVEA